METKRYEYQEFLRDSFSERIQRNSSYSLRAYARDLGLSVASLSRILAGKQGISLDAASKVSEVLELNETERNVFLSLVQSKHARSKKTREEAKAKLRTNETQVAELSLEYFRSIADWYHFAIIELTGVEGFSSEPRWIAKRLNVTLEKVRTAIDRLFELELIERTETGSFRKTLDFRATPSGIPSRALKQRHSQILRKAETALDVQTLQDREFASITFSLHTDDLNWARDEMKKFRRELTARLTNRPVKNRLYEFSMQLFALDQVAPDQKQMNLKPKKPNERSKK